MIFIRQYAEWHRCAYFRDLWWPACCSFRNLCHGQEIRAKNQLNFALILGCLLQEHWARFGNSWVGEWQWFIRHVTRNTGAWKAEGRPSKVMSDLKDLPRASQQRMWRELIYHFVFHAHWRISNSVSGRNVCEARRKGSVTELSSPKAYTASLLHPLYSPDLASANFHLFLH